MKLSLRLGRAVEPSILIISNAEFMAAIYIPLDEAAPKYLGLLNSTKVRSEDFEVDLQVSAVNLTISTDEKLTMNK